MQAIKHGITKEWNVILLKQRCIPSMADLALADLQIIIQANLICQVFNWLALS